jgi:hypothetical protein
MAPRSKYQSNTRSRSRSTNDTQKPQGKKKTGAKFKFADKNGNPCTTGWNVSQKHGLVTFLCVFTGKTKVVDSGSGRTWANVMVKVTKQMSPPFITNGMMDVNNGTVTVEDLRLVIKPSAPNGGYCGKY